MDREEDFEDECRFKSRYRLIKKNKFFKKRGDGRE